MYVHCMYYYYNKYPYKYNWESKIIRQVRNNVKIGLKANESNTKITSI